MGGMGSNPTLLEDTDHLLKNDPFTELSPTAVARADGRGAPNPQEQENGEEQRKTRARETLQKAQQDIATASMFSNDPEVKRLENELNGVDPDNIDTQKLERLAKEAKEKAAEEAQQAVTGGLLTLVGIGAAMAAMGVKNDGKNYSGDQLFTAAMMYDNSLPGKQQDGQFISY
jgi:hypothetical protein